MAALLGPFMGVLAHWFCEFSSISEAAVTSPSWEWVPLAVEATTFVFTGIAQATHLNEVEDGIGCAIIVFAGVTG